MSLLPTFLQFKRGQLRQAVSELVQAAQEPVWLRVRERLSDMGINESAGYIRAASRSVLKQYAVGRLSSSDVAVGLQMAADELVRRLLRRSLESPARQAA